MPLDWIPYERSLVPPSWLKDFQRDWVARLRDFSFFEQRTMQGYLSMTSDLWRIAGAHCRDCWEKEKSAVLACFERATVNGQEVIFYPPLIESIRKQAKRLRNRRAVDVEELSTNSQSSTEGAGGFPSPSQPEFVFDSEVQKQKPRSVSKARESNGYTQSDFDARDLRNMAQAYKEFNRRFCSDGATGSNHNLSDREIFEWVCANAGVRIARGLELEKLQKKWPTKPSTFAAAGD